MPTLTIESAPDISVRNSKGAEKTKNQGDALIDWYNSRDTFKIISITYVEAKEVHTDTNGAVDLKVEEEKRKSSNKITGEEKPFTIQTYVEVN